jgi:hypothetical protein
VSLVFVHLLLHPLKTRQSTALVQARQGRTDLSFCLRAAAVCDKQVLLRFGFLNLGLERP